MKNLRAALVIGCAAAGFGLSPAHADPYRWCAVYSGDAGGATNCGFVTIEQCRATVSGIGGMCEPNQFYTGPDSAGERVLKRVRPAYSR